MRRMIVKRKILFGALLFIGNILFAQDIHFSQFYNSPLNLNPACTGAIDGNIRGVLNYRNQWNSVAVPFVTSSVSVDGKMLNDLLKGDAIGIGMNIISDKVGEGRLSNFQMMINASYQKVFGSEKEHMIAFGIQSGFFQRKIDYTNLTFSSQYTNGDFNTNLISGENLTDNNISNIDIHSGILYQLRKVSGFGMNAGFSVYHLLRPNESLTGSIARIPLRYALHWGIKSWLSEKTSFEPDILFMKQNKAKELNIGGRINHAFKTKNDIMMNAVFGTGYRTSDALILLAGAKYSTWEVYFSYDINTSNLHPATNYNGGFELSIIFTDELLTGKNRLPFKEPCIRLF